MSSHASHGCHVHFHIGGFNDLIFNSRFLFGTFLHHSARFGLIINDLLLHNSLIFANFVEEKQLFMSQICLYVELDPYLAQWFIHDSGGSQPVELKYGSVESKILEVYLAKRPPDIPPDVSGEGKVAIYIPTFRYRPAEFYNYLPKAAMASFLNAIRNRFDIALWNDLHNFGKIGKRQDELIYAWMEKNGIEMTEANWNAIAKRYQRQREKYLGRLRFNKFYKKSKK